MHKIDCVIELLQNELSQKSLEDRLEYIKSLGFDAYIFGQNSLSKDVISSYNLYAEKSILKRIYSNISRILHHKRNYIDFSQNKFNDVKENLFSSINEKNKFKIIITTKNILSRDKQEIFDNVNVKCMDYDNNSIVIVINKNESIE